LAFWLLVLSLPYKIPRDFKLGWGDGELCGFGVCLLAFCISMAYNQAGVGRGVTMGMKDCFSAEKKREGREVLGWRGKFLNPSIKCQSDIYLFVVHSFDTLAWLGVLATTLCYVAVVFNTSLAPQPSHPFVHSFIHSFIHPCPFRTVSVNIKSQIIAD
jgi:hypothetical protein